MPKLVKSDIEDENLVIDQEEFLEDEDEIVEDDLELDASDEELDESVASDTLQPNSMPVGPANKAAAIGKVVNAMAGMDTETINRFVATINQIGHEADSIDGGAAGKNKNTLNTKPSNAGVQLVDRLESVQLPVADLIKEDVSKIFEGENLTEDFKNKVSVLIESVINLKADQRILQIEEEYAQLYEEELDTIAVNLASALDEMLDFAITEWLEQNQVAIESSLKNDLTEDFISNLKSLFETHYINIPEDKADILEEMGERIDELEDSESARIDEILSLRQQIADLESELVVSEVTKGLAASDAEKLREMAETIEFVDNEDLANKINILKENYFGSAKTKTPSSSTQVLFEEVENIEEEASQPKLRGPMAAYVSAISRNSH